MGVGRSDHGGVGSGIGPIKEQQVRGTGLQTPPTPSQQVDPDDMNSNVDIAFFCHRR